MKALLLLLAAGAAVGGIAQQATTKSRWEYVTVMDHDQPMGHHYRRLIVGEQEISYKTEPVVVIDSLGREGWELAAVTKFQLDAGVRWTEYYFKRPLQ